jgi:hypothetical protein
MKTIELQDEESWFIEISENAEKVRYSISGEVYEKLEIIVISGEPTCNIFLQNCSCFQY